MLKFLQSLSFWTAGVILAITYGIMCVVCTVFIGIREGILLAYAEVNENISYYLREKNL